MRTYFVIIITLFNCIIIYSQDIQKYLECENAKIDKISGIEKETIKKVRNKYPIDQFYLSRIDSGIYNVCYKSSSYKWGILNGDELVLPMIYKKVNSSIIKDRGVKRYLIISQYSKVGLFDLQNLTWKIPLIYEELSKFDGGDYQIYIDRNAGVTNLEGKIILEPKYSRIEFNKNIGVYIVKDLNDNIGIFDPNINYWILPCTFKNVSNYTSKNLVLTKNDSTFLFTSNKKLEFHEEIHINDTDKVIIIGEKGKYTIQDYNHKKVIKTEFSDIDYIIGHSDLITKLKNNKYSLFNTAFKKSMDKLYDNIKREKSYFLVQKNYKYGVVKFEDDKYIEILPCIFDEIDIELEYYIAKKEGKNFIYTKQGKKIIDENFDDIRIITFYSAKNIVSGNKQFAENSNYGELAIIGASERYGVFNLKGERMIKKDYQHIAPLITYMHDSRRTNTQLCVGLIYKENQFYGIMDLNGNIILSAEYSEIRHLNRGLVQIRKNEEYAIFDYVNNQFLTQFKYSQLMSYNNDCIGIINTDYFNIKIYENFKEGKIVSNVIENKLELNFLSRNSTKKNNKYNWYYQNIEPTKSDIENMKKIINYYNNSTYHYYIANNGLYYVEENHNKGVYYDSIGMLTPFYANRHEVTRFSPLLKNNMYPIPILSRYGLYDLKNRKYKILPKYDNFKVMKDGELFIASIDNHYNLINENDETVMDLGYLDDEPIHFDDAIILKNILGKYGILSLKNKTMKINFEYNDIFPYLKNNIAFAKKNSTYKLISHDNNVLDDKEIDKIEKLLIEDLLLIQTGNDFYIFNPKEKVFIPFNTKSNRSNVLADVLEIFLKNKTNDSQDLKSSLEKLDTYHFIDKLPYHSSKYQYFRAVTNNRYVLLKVGENNHIEEVVQFENELCQYNDKLGGFIFMQNGKLGFIRIDGTIKLDPIFDQIYSTKYYGSNILCAIDNDLYFIFSNSNDTSNFKVKEYKIIYEHSFKEPFYHNKGQIYVIKGVDKDNKKMLYDTYGKPMLDTSYDEITHLGDSYFLIKSNENVGLLDLNHKIKIKMQPEFKNIFYADGVFYGVNDNKIIKSFTPY